MPDPDLITLFVHPLGRLGIRYMVSGSVAVSLFGEPRLTHDVDIVVFLADADVARLPTLYAAPAFYLPPLDVIAVERARERRGHFNVIHAGSGLKADFYTSNRDPLHDWAIARARRLSVDGEPITVAPPEYVILRKLEYFREGGSEKHLRDVRSIIAVSGDDLDHPALAAWVTRLALEPQWRVVGEPGGVGRSG